MNLFINFLPLESARFSTDFSLMNDWTNKLQFFTGIDIIMTIMWLVISIVILQFIKGLNREKEYYKYYMWNFYFHLFFAVTYSIYYIFFVQGGDCVAYWDASLRLTNLLYQNPENYFHELFQYQGSKDYINYYNNVTGIPPDWIAKEREGYFCAKIYSFFNPFTQGSFFALVVITSLISSIASFHLFDFLKRNSPFATRNSSILILFIPSVAFWCSGISKDVIIYTITCIIIPIFFQFNKEKEKRLKRILILILCFYITYKIRDFMLLVFIIPLVFTYNLRLSRYLFEGAFMQQLSRVLLVAISIFTIGLFIGKKGDELKKQAEQQYQEFNSKSYTGKKFQIGESDFSNLGILKMAPMAIFSAVFRPLPWEALSPGLIINGIESVFLIVLLLQFIRKNFWSKVSFLRNDQTTVYFIYFVLILAVITGITSVLFGVLVRVRAPLLPFFLFLLLIPKKIEFPAGENSENATDDHVQLKS